MNKIIDKLKNPSVIVYLVSAIGGYLMAFKILEPNQIESLVILTSGLLVVLGIIDNPNTKGFLQEVDDKKVLIENLHLLSKEELLEILEAQGTKE